jgi:hypothetical protein
VDVGGSLNLSTSVGVANGGDDGFIVGVSSS